MPSSSTILIEVKKISSTNTTHADDVLAIEEPLEIRLIYSGVAKTESKTISITMRTPGADKDLATGFLFTEGIINSGDDISRFAASENSITVQLNKDIAVDLNHIDRNCYTTSSCGVCGKTSIDAIRTVGKYLHSTNQQRYPATLFKSLPDKLKKQQEVFKQTGGLHASALFNADGELVIVKEDVGRHNALDKLIGAALISKNLPLNDYILLLSGRISFELVQKAAMAGIKIVAAIGAPSSLAVETARSFDITLIGFLNSDRMNIYSNTNRIVF